ncbi:MAG: transaldolase [Bacteroidota bacterium]
MTRLLLGLSFISIVACSDGVKECPSVILSGEIVNPTSDFVVLYKDDMIIDSAKLNENDHFSFKLQGIEEGLYHFDHSPELQYVYLQEGDSLLIRLNTIEFDESLVFSGEGSEINNFLVEMFLAHENEEMMVYNLYKLDPDSFSNKIDSLRAKKIQQLEELVEENNLTEKVFAMAKASIDYNTYLYKEKYPFYHKKKTGEETINDLDDSFYGYRKNLNLNDHNLTYFRPYFDFMKHHLGNLAYMSCMKECATHGEVMMSHLHFNKHILHLVDSLVDVPEIRNNLFRNVAMDYLLKEHNTNEESRIFIEKFKKLSTDEEHKKEIAYLYKGIQSLQPNKSLPNLQVRNVDNEPVDLKEISKKKKTVFYFWTSTQKKHLKNILGHVAKLKKKHPDHNFVGISIRTSEPQWMKTLEEYGLDKSTQFRGEDFEKVQTAMIVDGLNKCVIVEDTLIVDAFANLYKSF